MALSFVQYTGDGSTTTFAVPFPYIAQSHIQVKVDGVLKTASTDYTFPTTSTLQFTTAPLNGLIVEIRRVTPRTERLVDFQDASTLTEATLDQDSNQNFFVAQEAFDLADSNIKLAPDNTFDAEGLRIKNLGAPTLPTDAVRVQDLTEDAGSVQLRADLNDTTDVTKGAALVPTAVRRIGTIADLRAAPIPTSQISINLLGYYAPGDGGGGQFYWDSASTETDNGGTVIVPTGYTGSGRWLRNYSGVVHIRWFGAKVDGVTDDTAAIQAAHDALSIFGGDLYLGGTAMVNGLLISKDGVKLSGGTLRQAAATLEKAASVVVTGKNFVGEDVNIDGNQAALTSAQGGDGLNISGNSPTLLRVTVKNANGVGLYLNSNTEGRFTDCHFDLNANLGMQMIAGAYHTFVGCTWNQNGYGFQVACPGYNVSDGYVAFGFALRFRCHHVQFIGCEARKNGRDGMNVNQGSYAISFIACSCHGNNDGGFTIAADSTSPGTPGDGESPYDLSYINCEADNNWTSGLVAYQPVHGLQVIGGRYYNNHRLAGSQPASDSYAQGIYLAAASTIRCLDTDCYDDRQSATVSGVSGAVVNLSTTWITGTYTTHPKVAFYSAAGAFKGYGTITAETASSITVTAAAYNGVNLAGLVAGDIASQAVQHNGAILANGCIGEATVRGWGHRAGGSGYTGGGKQLLVGWYGNAQNVRIPKAQGDGVNRILNPTFDTDVTTNWAYDLAGGGSATLETTRTRSAGALKLVAGTGPVYGSATLETNTLKAAQGAFIRYSADVDADRPGGVYIQLYWFLGGSAYTSYVLHRGGSVGQRLELSCYIGPDVTSVEARVVCEAGFTGYFDNLRLEIVSPPEIDYAVPQRGLPL